MGKRLWAAVAALVLLSGCAHAPAEEDRTHILATTYPVYLFTTALTDGMEDVEVDLLVNSQTSCLHDYTLTVKDMKAIEKADIIVMNGAGLEDFMADALSLSDAQVIDCSMGMDLLPGAEDHGHEGHDHDLERDPHFWMDPRLASGMSARIAQTLFLLLPERTEFLAQRQDTVARQLAELSLPHELAGKPFIPFHDGFQYFSAFTGLDLLTSIEEEEGSTASAREIRDILTLIWEYDIPAIFAEKNGSHATAELIARETDRKLYELDMLMSGEGVGLQPYLDAMNRNLETIREAFHEDP